MLALGLVCGSGFRDFPMEGVGCGPGCCESILSQSVFVVYIDDMSRVCVFFVGGWFSDGVKFGLVFGIRL